MRKYTTICIVFFLTLALLVGCSSQQEDKSNAPLDDQETTTDNLLEETHIPKEISADELQKAFQEVYESSGNSRSQEDEQIAVELDALQKAVADISAKLPENFKEQYREWRSAEITARIEADRLVLMEEYAQIIADRPVYAPAVNGLCEASPGLCYAEYVDFDHDGLSELLLVSVVSAEEDPVKIEVYGLLDGHAVQYGKIEKPVYLAGSLDVLLCKKDEQICLGTCSWAGGTAYPFIYSFYDIEDGALTFADNIFAVRDEIGIDTNGWTYKYYSCEEDLSGGIDPDEVNRLPVKEITEEQYNNISEGYGERNNIFSGSGDRTIQFTYESGIAPTSPVPSITVNGNMVELGAELYGESNHIVAPLRPVLEAMGIPVYSNAAATVVVASTKNDSLSIIDGGWLMWDGTENGENYGLYNVKFNGEAQSAPVDLKYKNRALFVPIADIVRMFGATAEWDEPTRTLAITSNIPTDSRMSADELNSMVTGFSFEEAVAIAENAGYMQTWDAYDVYDYFDYAFGRAYYFFYALPAEVSSYDTDTRYYMTVGSNGSVAAKPTTYISESDL